VPRAAAGPAAARRPVTRPARPAVPASMGNEQQAGERQEGEAPRWMSRLPLVGAVAATGFRAARRCFSHRLRQPVQRAASPVAEIFFGLTLYGTIRAAVRGYLAATDSFRLRDELFQEMAVAHTYKNSLWPWLQTGGIALGVSLLIIFGVKAFIKSMKEWEQEQEVKELDQMGPDAIFLMSTPVDATPLEKKKKKMARRLQPLPVRIMGAITDWLWITRLLGCVGYLLPLLNVLDFGEISISLNPYPLGIPVTEPIVNFLMNNMHLRVLYNAYLKSGYYFIIVWFLFIQLTVRNKAMPFFVRFHSSQAILISMLLGVPQQVFFAVLNPWESGLLVQTFMYHSMVSLFLFTVVLIIFCISKTLLKQNMKLPLVSEAAVMWAGKE